MSHTLNTAEQFFQFLKSEEQSRAKKYVDQTLDGDEEHFAALFDAFANDLTHEDQTTRWISASYLT